MDKTREEFEKYCHEHFDIYSQFECWQAATAAAEEKYLPVINLLGQALREIAFGQTTITEADCADVAKKALALAAPLLGGK